MPKVGKVSEEDIYWGVSTFTRISRLDPSTTVARTMINARHVPYSGLVTGTADVNTAIDSVYGKANVAIKHATSTATIRMAVTPLQTMVSQTLLAVSSPLSTLTGVFLQQVVGVLTSAMTDRPSAVAYSGHCFDIYSTVSGGFFRAIVYGT